MDKNNPESASNSKHPIDSLSELAFFSSIQKTQQHKC